MNRSPRLARLAATCAALIVAASARADWPTSGRALCTDTADQFLPMIAPDGTGGAIVAWGDDRLPFSTFSERVLRNGFIASSWPADGAQIGATTSYYSQGRGASDDAGGAYFAWGGDDLPGTFHVFLQHVTGAGQVVTGWPANGLVVGNTSGIGSLSRIAADGAGGVFVCWNDNTALRIQRVQADGTPYPGWAATGELVTNVAGSYGTPYVVGDGSGGAIVVWTDVGSDPGDVWAQRIDSGGAPASGWPAAGIVVSAESGLQNARQPIADGAGGAWIPWGDDRNLGTTGRDIYVQRITGSGAPATGWPAGGLAVCDAPGTQSQPHLADDGAGGAFVVWLDRRTAADGDPYIQHLNPDGTLVSGWPAKGMAVSTASGGEQLSDDAVVSDGAGGAIVVWSDARDSLTTARDVYAQRLDSSGSVHGGWASNGVALSVAAGDQSDVHAVSDGSGGAIVAWTDERSGDPSHRDIYAIGIRSDGTTPVLAALVSAEAADGRVRLDWYAPQGLPAGSSIERRTGDGPWTAIAPAVRDGLGHVHYEDRAVAPGIRYGYRLADSQGPLTSESSVDVPVTALSLVEAVADGSGEVRVRFSLASSRPASFQLFDVAGRCVRSLPQEGLGAGAHETRIPGALASGAYWLRLEQGGVSVRRQVLVVR